MFQCRSYFLSNKDQLQKESLNRDDQQFNQYQQNEQSPLTSFHRTPKKGGDHNI